MNGRDQVEERDDRMIGQQSESDSRPFDAAHTQTDGQTPDAAHAQNEDFEVDAESAATGIMRYTSLENFSDLTASVKDVPPPGTSSRK